MEEEIYKQLKDLPRQEIAKVAIQNSKLILLKPEKPLLSLINGIYPEHFIVCSKNEDYFVDLEFKMQVRFYWKLYSRKAGDYASGMIHIA